VKDYLYEYVLYYMILSIKCSLV